MNEQVNAWIEAIRRDNTSGAVALTVQGAETLALLAQITQARSAVEFRAELLEAGQALIAAQPAMASFFNLVNAVLLSVEEARDMGTLRETVEGRARRFAGGMEQRSQRIAEAALGLIYDGATLMTISYSATVLAALLRAREAGKRFRVVCPESRPQREGVALAQRLGNEGIEAVVIVDAAAAHFMDKVQLAFVGADSLSAQGLVNKVGTYGLALAARAHKVPFYALCGTEKFLASARPFHQMIEERDPREVLPQAWANVRAINVYFDPTPLDLLSSVVTERGLLSPPEIMRDLDGIQVHTGLMHMQDT
jgi:translation initiation factor eIF-2B subunit delta